MGWGTSYISISFSLRSESMSRTSNFFGYYELRNLNRRGPHAERVYTGAMRRVDEEVQVAGKPKNAHW
jgi:hypothetical protein